MSKRKAADKSSSSSSSSSSSKDNKKNDNDNDENDEVTKHNKRKEAQSRVAHARASHFARADDNDDNNNNDDSFSKRSKKSSTPTGYVKIDGDDENVAIGAFTVANELIAKREEVRRLREEAIASGNAGHIKAIDIDSMDEYDKMLQNLTWNPSILKEKDKYVYIDSLTDICVKYLVQNFDAIESLDDIPTEIRELVAIELAKQRKLLPASVDMLATPGSEALILPDCSMLDEVVVIKCIESVAADSRNIRILKLGVVGSSFGDDAAKKVTKYLEFVETLELTGCYRLNDDALIPLLSACHKSLQNLNLSCDSRLGPKGLSSIANTCMNLKTLVIENCTHMSNEDIASLVTNSSASFGLEGLSIVGMTDITDDTFISLVKRFGPTLKSLNCSGCTKLTDNTIIAIKQYCSNLLTLGISHLRCVTTAALIGLFMPDIIDENSSSSSSSSSSRSIGTLQHVELQGVVNVTDDVIIQLSLLSKGSLLTLNIASCSLLTSKAIIALKKNCLYSLRTIDMSFVRGISEDSLGCFMDAAIDMKLLSVWGCTQLTNKFFSHTFSNDVKIIGQMNA